MLETIRQTAAEVKGRADLIIALGHVNESEAAQILAEAPEVPWSWWGTFTMDTLR